MVICHMQSILNFLHPPNYLLKLIYDDDTILTLLQFN